MIVVAGEALVDLIVRPDGALVPVAGGGSFNVARAIGRLGVEVSWLGSLSADRFGRELEAGLAADGVALTLAHGTERPTTLALAELDEDGTASYRFYVDGTSASDLRPGDVPPLPTGTVAVEVGSLGLVLEPAASTLEGLVGGLADEVVLMIDPNCRPSVVPDADAYRARIGRLLRRADILRASTEDLAFLLPGIPPLDAAREIAAAGPRVVLVTDGARSVTALVGGEAHELPVPRIEVVDTVGAGDTFGGAFLACLVHEGRRRGDVAEPDAVVRAAAFAIRAGAQVCRRAGADPPRLDQLGGWPAAGR